MWIAVGAFAAVLLGAAVWLGCDLLAVREEMAQAQDAVAALRSGGDIGDNLHRLGESGAAAAQTTSGPIWRAAEVVPNVGDNFRAVRLAAQSLDELSNGIALPIVDGMKTGGSLAALIPPLRAAAPAVESLSTELAALPRDNLIPQVRDGVDQVGSVLKLATPAVTFLPGLLGADGPKNYLVVAQNNAELMPLGGSAASATLVRVADGKPQIVKQADSQDFDYARKSSVQLPRSVLRLYGPTMTTHPNATVSRPDWPTAAGLMLTLWNRDISADRVDGVVSIDPIALSFLMKATGPVRMPDGETLTSENIVKVALSESYAKYGDHGDHGDSYFKEIAEAVFARIAGGDFDSKMMLQAVQEAIGNRSLMFWSADKELQKLVASTRLGGVLPHSNTAATSIGVFFRDHSLGTKIDYYLKPSVEVRTECGADGATTYTVSVNVHLDISPAAEAKLPNYVRAHLPGRRYDTEVFIYGPRNAELVGHTQHSAAYNLRAKDLGRWVAKLTVSTTPGQSGQVTATFTVPADGGELGPTQVLTTPTVHPAVVSTPGQACQPQR